MIEWRCGRQLKTSIFKNWGNRKLSLCANINIIADRKINKSNKRILKTQSKIIIFKKYH